MNDLFTKNREREAPSFANINLLGKCNIRCYFCLGRDIEAELAGQNQLVDALSAMAPLRGVP